MIDFKVEPSYRQLYLAERAENRVLKKANISLHADKEELIKENLQLKALNEALTRMLETWDRERKEKASEEALKGN